MSARRRRVIGVVTGTEDGTMAPLDARGRLLMDLLHDTSWWFVCDPAADTDDARRLYPNVVKSLVSFFHR